MTEPLVYIKGARVPASQAHVAIFDAAIVLGATVTDLARTFSGAPFRLGDRDQAGAQRLAIDMHHAGPAISIAAAIFRARQVRRIAQRPQQGRIRIHQIFDRSAVHRHSRHAALPFSRSVLLSHGARPSGKIAASLSP